MSAVHKTGTEAVLLVDVVRNENPFAVVWGGVSRGRYCNDGGPSARTCKFCNLKWQLLVSSPSKLQCLKFRCRFPFDDENHRQTDKLTYSIPKSPTQTRARHRVSSPNLCTALPSPSFPIRHKSSAPVHSHSKGSLMNYARRWIRKNITKRPRCMSFAQLHVTTADLMRCRPGEHAP